MNSRVLHHSEQDNEKFIKSCQGDISVSNSAGCVRLFPEAGFIFDSEVIQAEPDGNRISIEVSGLEPNSTHAITAFLSNGRSRIKGPKKAFTVEETDPVIEIPDTAFRAYLLKEFDTNKDFMTFCADIRNNAAFESTFFTAKYVSASDLDKGATLTIGWKPNRLVTLKYLGDSRFKVVKSENSQLVKDDEFESTSFILGFPLYIPRILRSGEYTPSYIAGGDDGLTLIETSGK